MEFLWTELTSFSTILTILFSKQSSKIVKNQIAITIRHTLLIVTLCHPNSYRITLTVFLIKTKLKIDQNESLRRSFSIIITIQNYLK